MIARVAWPMRCSFSIEREPHVAVAAGAEADARASRDVALADEERRELDRAELGERLGDRRPGEHRAERAARRPTDPGEPVAERVASDS